MIETEVIGANMKQTLTAPVGIWWNLHKILQQTHIPGYFPIPTGPPWNNQLYTTCTQIIDKDSWQLFAHMCSKVWLSAKGLAHTKFALDSLPTVLQKSKREARKDGFIRNNACHSFILCKCAHVYAQELTIESVHGTYNITWNALTQFLDAHFTVQ